MLLMHVFIKACNERGNQSTTVSIRHTFIHKKSQLPKLHGAIGGAPSASPGSATATGRNSSFGLTRDVLKISHGAERSVT